jgi:glutamate formiminotransferase/glutamate formiminotransferase/formiminotetrahydrofolate cyclodeaminase
VELPLESVPNVSEGRDPGTLAALCEAFSAPARLLDVHADPDHNRSVFTLVGDGDELVETLTAGIERAIGLIDLRRHEGVHPRVGAVDVVPLVPLRPEDEPRARAAALALADRIAALGVPVFFYGRLAEDGREPAFFRRGGIEALAPDRGPARLHPTAGAVLLGVRPPLIAFNVNLRTDDVEIARAIARAVRERHGGFPGVRALGLDLPRAGRCQVSMNVTNWRAAPLHEVVAAIRREAAARGVEVAGSELVGLMPAGAAVAAAGAALGLERLDESQILELRLGVESDHP